MIALCFLFSLSLFLSLSLFSSFSPPVTLFLYVTSQRSLSLYVPPLCLSMSPLSVSLCPCMSLFVSLCLSVFLCVSLCLYVTLHISLRLSVSLCLSLHSPCFLLSHCPLSLSIRVSPSLALPFPFSFSLFLFESLLFSVSVTFGRHDSHPET